MPALRERRSDIMLLAEHFLEKYSKMYNKVIKRISTPAINMMMAYHWPGNVRELENCIDAPFSLPLMKSFMPITCLRHFRRLRKRNRHSAGKGRES
jgi:transcriptional regulator with PAS, ATPase and Fis domain